MRALSIRQPWAWLIIHASKDIENRDWRTEYRGRVLIHAGKTMTKKDWEEAVAFARFECGISADVLWEGCEYDRLQRGGVVGAVDIVDCVDESESPWFMGPHGFVLRNAAPVPFTPWNGKLGFFDVPLSALAAASAAGGEAPDGRSR